MTDTMVSTGPCPFCHTASILSVPTWGYELWRAGALVQNAFPNLSLDDREQLISGTHGECFNQMFGEEE